MLIRRGNNLLKTNFRLLSQQFNDPIQSFRTSETNPVCFIISKETDKSSSSLTSLFQLFQINHSTLNSGQFYSIPNAVTQNIFKHGGLPMSFQNQTKTFTETCVMIRNPALEVIDILKKYDPTKPAFRFVLCNFFFNFLKYQYAYVLQKLYENYRWRFRIGKIFNAGTSSPLRS